MAEFEWLNKQGVISNRGFRVQMVGRNCIEYSEGSRVLNVDVEFGMDSGFPCLLFSPGSFSCWEGTGEPLSFEERCRVEDNFRRALEFQGVRVVAELPE